MNISEFEHASPLAQVHLVGWKVDSNSKVKGGDSYKPTLLRREPGSVSPVTVSRGVLPMEKGINASLFLNFPLSSRKCWELKSLGLEKNLGSFSMELSIGHTSVP